MRCLIRFYRRVGAWLLAAHADVLAEEQAKRDRKTCDEFEGQFSDHG